MSALRHTAALALVGWYLMVPPFDLDKAVVDDIAPLSKWTMEDSFDSVDEGKAQVARQIAQANRAEKEFDRFDPEQRKLAKKGDPAAQQWLRDDAKATPAKALRYTGTLIQHDADIVSGLCISAKDPRLKANQ